MKKFSVLEGRKVVLGHSVIQEGPPGTGTGTGAEIPEWFLDKVNKNNWLVSRISNVDYRGLSYQQREWLEQLRDAQWKEAQ